jgi:hypothetical protein
MKANRWSSPDCPPVEVRAHHLLCAVCVRGGCRNPPPGKRAIDKLLQTMWEFPYVPLRIMADVDVTRGHFFDAYQGRGGTLPSRFRQRSADHVWRRLDLEVCRVLGIPPNSTLQPYHLYIILFSRRPTLEGLCRTGSELSTAWPRCPHATRGYYEKIAGTPHCGLEQQTVDGEKLAGRGLWAMIRPRTRKEMLAAKKESADYILNKATRLYIRPNHLLCILCRMDREDPLIEDNLIELRKRMEKDPDIPVTVSEGCCMVCDPCNVYHPGEHLCYHAHFKNTLRDLMFMEKLGIAPGTTMPARKLYALIYRRLKSLKDVCGWRDGTNYGPLWTPCGGYQGTILEEARRRGILAGKPARKERPRP